MKDVWVKFRTKGAVGIYLDALANNPSTSGGVVILSNPKSTSHPCGFLWSVMNPTKKPTGAMTSPIAITPVRNVIALNRPAQPEYS
ncbi:MAG TPA: hypothetical protein VMZ26_15675 [Pyrinomonadaceae bacterium]|nr:hypothetical protein [Pyrinomonadaceae bacterium]